MDEVRRVHRLRSDTMTCLGCPPGTTYRACPELRAAATALVRAGLEDPL